MHSSDKVIWTLVTLPLVAILLLFLRGETDRQRYDRLEIGMSKEEVEAIVKPRASHFRDHRPTRPHELGDNETLRINDRMVLVIHNGRLVDKRWNASHSDEDPWNR